MSAALQPVARRPAPRRAHRPPSLRTIDAEIISPPLGAPRNTLSAAKRRFYELKARPLASRLIREIATLYALSERAEIGVDWREAIQAGILARARRLSSMDPPRPPRPRK